MRGILTAVGAGCLVVASLAAVPGPSSAGAAHTVSTPVNRSEARAGTVPTAPGADRRRAARSHRVADVDELVLVQRHQLSVHDGGHRPGGRLGDDPGRHADPPAPSDLCQRDHPRRDGRGPGDAVSPMFKSVGTIAAGRTQYGDAMQHASFWDQVSTVSPGYHVLLSQPKVLNTVLDSTFPRAEVRPRRRRTVRRGG